MTDRASRGAAADDRFIDGMGFVDGGSRRELERSLGDGDFGA